MRKSLINSPMIKKVLPTLFLMAVASTASAAEYFTIEDGELQRPSGYREWVYAGTPVTPNELNNGKAASPEFHNVYIDPESWAHWKVSGEFREGTILIKELVAVGSKAAVSGNGYFQGNFVGLEATIKSAAHFPNEPGNWAYYSFPTPDGETLTTTATATAMPTASCNSCHDASAADDFVFTQILSCINGWQGHWSCCDWRRALFIKLWEGNMKKVNILALLGITLVVATGVNMISVAAQGNFSSRVNSNGDISFPEGFRDSMVHLGAWFVPEGGASGFHDVYTERASVEAYRETGLFPDGATLVKELRVSLADDYTTGKGVSYATEDIKQWFVMIKDSQGRFGSNPVWGDGWGWALFTADDTTQNAASNYENDCLACHVPARDNDWIYTEAYPTLTTQN